MSALCPACRYCSRRTTHYVRLSRSQECACGSHNRKSAHPILLSYKEPRPTCPADFDDRFEVAHALLTEAGTGGGPPVPWCACRVRVRIHFAEEKDVVRRSSSSWDVRRAVKNTYRARKKNRKGSNAYIRRAKKGRKETGREERLGTPLLSQGAVNPSPLIGKSRFAFENWLVKEEGRERGERKLSAVHENQWLLDYHKSVSARYVPTWKAYSSKARAE